LYFCSIDGDPIKVARTIDVKRAELSKPCVLIRDDMSVWVVAAIRWWDLATLIWWWLCPSDKRAIICMRLGADLELRVPAKRLAPKYFTPRML